MSRPKFEVTADVLEKVEVYAAQGMTKEQIALSLGICYDTLNERQKESSEFSDAIKRGQAKGIATITNALFVAGKGGNITAQIFYLKNRGSDEWKDRMVHSGDEDHPLLPGEIVVKVIKSETAKD